MQIEAVPKRTSKLIMVTSENNNKYYEMREEDDGMFTASYGRVGSRGSVRRYPMKDWNKKYREKVRKGYRDVTPLFAARRPEPALRIEDPAVKRLIDTLTQCADRAIHRNYTVTAAQVTRRQVDEAQALLDELAGQAGLGMDVPLFNARLLELYTVIPRRMGDVRTHLVDTIRDAEAVTALRDRLGQEQDVLDVMAGQVQVNEQSSRAKGEPQTLLEALGLTIRPVEAPSERKRVERMMGDAASLLRRAYHVENTRTRKAFEQRLSGASNPAAALLWHGSRNENWLSILERGLTLRPAHAVITGKMFGYGLYFADRFQKSLNYTSLRGSCWSGGSDHRAFMALYDVHVGRQLKVRTYAPWCAELTADNLEKRSGRLRKPYDSVLGKRGLMLQNNEYIVYDEAQCTVRYLLEIERA